MRFVERHRLEKEQQELLQAAERVATTSRSPYSAFPVGAAVRLRGRDGEARVVTGNNFETAHYRSVCAERHALHRAYAEHSWEEDGELRRPRIEAVAVYCARAAGPQQPCGDCRQTLSEIDGRIQILAASGPGEGGAHDPRATLTTVAALLPYAFDELALRGELEGEAGLLADGDLADQIIHLPRPGDLERDAAARAALLVDVRYLILVGSPRRARLIAELGTTRWGGDADASCYCDLTRPERDEVGREYAVYSFALPGGGRVAAVSHGIGQAGVEIVLSELPALFALAADGQPPAIAGVLRCGTRGTLSATPPGAIALTTIAHDERFDRLPASPHWLDRLRAAARARGMDVVADSDLEAERGWREPSRILAEGPGISTAFFWQGQGRPLYRGGAEEAPAAAHEVRQLEGRRHHARLAAWHAAGIRWIEMEDYTVLRVAAECGLPAATLGAVLGQRRRPDGAFQASYSKAALATSELIPAEIALDAIAADASEG